MKIFNSEKSITIQIDNIWLTAWKVRPKSCICIKMFQRFNKAHKYTFIKLSFIYYFHLPFFLIYKFQTSPSSFLCVFSYHCFLWLSIFSIFTIPVRLYLVFHNISGPLERPSTTAVLMLIMMKVMVIFWSHFSFFKALSL